jgi:hypothetical protein
VASNKGFNEAYPLVVIQWIRDPKFGERSAQASPMLGPPKRYPRVHWDDFVHAVAKNESPVEHRDGRGRKRHERAIEPADLVISGRWVEDGRQCRQHGLEFRGRERGNEEARGKGEG